MFIQMTRVNSGTQSDVWLNPDQVVLIERAPNNPNLTRVTLAVHGKNGEYEQIVLRGDVQRIAAQLSCLQG